MAYIFLFISKFLENMLATIRIIVLAKGYKQIGAILQFIIALIWVSCTGAIIKDIDNIGKILFFAFGCYLGSLVGSIIEERVTKN